MQVWFVLTCSPCQCGYRNRGGTLRDVRVLKGSLRTLDRPGLAWTPQRCRECDAPLGTSAVEHRLDPESLATVNAYRARRGWPAVAA